jgi:hypothetical protein
LSRVANAPKSPLISARVYGPGCQSSRLISLGSDNPSPSSAERVGRPHRRGRAGHRTLWRTARRPVKPGNAERLRFVAFLLRHVVQPKGIDPPISRIEVAGDLDSPRCAVGLAQDAAIRRDETRMQNRELKKAARSQDPCSLAQDTALFGHVHHRHERPVRPWPVPRRPKGTISNRVSTKRGNALLSAKLQGSPNLPASPAGFEPIAKRENVATGTLVAHLTRRIKPAQRPLCLSRLTSSVPPRNEIGTRLMLAAGFRHRLPELRYVLVNVAVGYPASDPHPAIAIANGPLLVLSQFFGVSRRPCSTPRPAARHPAARERRSCRSGSKRRQSRRCRAQLCRGLEFHGSGRNC